MHEIELWRNGAYWQTEQADQARIDLRRDQGFLVYVVDP